MYIKKIELNGFKSYSQNTVIDGWDNMFNAITGLNGSGKSNILDSICFVLGITNLKQVRATCLKDLIYKAGQAGITKATVTITFDNSDPNCAPTLYDPVKYPEITITRDVVDGGKSRYKICGLNAQNNRVADLFRSVGLNVNNPHFLIMQGRITKVLNMKGHETLSMIEEAAGTKMYDAKKMACERTIKSKEKTLAEIDAMMKDEVEPLIEQCKADKGKYNDLQKAKTQKESLKHLFVAFKYTEHKTGMTEAGDKRVKKEEEIVQCEQEAAQLTKQREAMQTTVDQLKAHNQQEKESREREHARDATEKLLAAAQSKLKEATDIKKTHAKTVKQLETSVKSDERKLATKQTELTQTEAANQGSVDGEKALNEAIAATQQSLQMLAKGYVRGEDGQQTTLQTQLADARSNRNELVTERQVKEEILKDRRPKLADAKKKLSNRRGSADQDQLKVDALQTRMQRMQVDIDNLGVDPTVLEQLELDKQKCAAEIEQLSTNINNFWRKNNLNADIDPRIKNQVDVQFSSEHFTFKYKFRASFDERRIKGKVGQLFTLKRREMAKALQMLAGGSLNSFVVDTDETGAAMIEMYKSPMARQIGSRKINVMPLNKLNGYKATDKARQAQQLYGADNVWLAMDLIEFDADVEPAMRLVFGSVLICATDKLAADICYDKRIGLRTMNMRGDLYNPEGSLSGGSNANFVTFLEYVNDVQADIKTLHMKRMDLQRLEEQIAVESPRLRQLREWQTQREDVSREVQLAMHRLANTDSARLQADAAQWTTDIAEAEAFIAGMAEQLKDLDTQIDKLQTKVNNQDQYQKQETAKAQKELKRLEEEKKQNEKVHMDAREALGDIRNQMNALRESIAAQQQQLVEARELLLASDEPLNNAQTLVDAEQKNVDEAKAALAQHSAAIKEREKAIESDENKIQQFTRQLNELELRVVAINNELAQEQGNLKHFEAEMKRLRTSNPWIEEAEKFFGAVGSEYDFTGKTVDQVGEQLRKVTDIVHTLGKEVNEEAIQKLNETEERANTLREHRAQVETDKNDILLTIEKMDDQKKAKILEAYEKVNKDFGEIFKKLLPNSFAKLQKSEDADGTLIGVDIRIRFGQDWKNSLTELSGGQRSLIALSLVLAMLKFKPAPIYILDEVDAALDLSHTQNIGAMIKEHFQGSQFIIVSLKDGMFNNANQLFTTKFIDGTSTVTGKRSSAAPVHNVAANK